MANLEVSIIDLINSSMRALEVKPLLLGGITSSGGGVGSPPGGFIGYLPQIRVCYDLSEDATLNTPESGASLIDNLNHIRYNILTLSGALDDIIISGVTSSGGGHEIRDADESFPQRAGLQFVGAGVVVSDDEVPNNTVITVPVGEAPIDGNLYARKDSDWETFTTSGIPDAPSDGNTYGRRDGEWVTVSGGESTGLTQQQVLARISVGV